MLDSEKSRVFKNINEKSIGRNPIVADFPVKIEEVIDHYDGYYTIFTFRPTRNSGKYIAFWSDEILTVDGNPSVDGYSCWSIKVTPDCNVVGDLSEIKDSYYMSKERGFLLADFILKKQSFHFVSEIYSDLLPAWEGNER